MEPKELEALADRIDYEQLWSRPGMEHGSFTPEQKDRLNAGINLRRYASDRGVVLEALKEGLEYIRGYKLTRPDNLSTDARGCGTQGWHSAINRFSDKEHAAGNPHPRMMYTARMIADEVPRMILLFEQERRGLPTRYRMCALDPAPATPLPDNHLRCALGVECRRCDYLAAIESDPAMTNEAKDEAKAWTCATHTLLRSQDEVYLDQVLRDKSDDAFDDRLARSFAGFA